MSEKSDIEWTDATWNPVRGCTKVSPGCKHCYAETFAERWRGVPGHPYEQGFDLRLVPEKLGEPLTWRKGRRVFVNSMSDLFHEDVPDKYIAAVFGVMALAPQHTFQVLTKRARRMREWFEWLARYSSESGKGLSHALFESVFRESGDAPIPRVTTTTIEAAGWPLPNVWLGASVENQQYADERIPHLLQTPAAVRFISAEPLLGPLDLTPYLVDDLARIGRAPRLALDWVIPGGESGPGARITNASDIRQVVEQCKEAGVPVFVKQLGATAIDTDWHGFAPLQLRSRKGGDMAEWPEDLRVRQFPEVQP